MYDDMLKSDQSVFMNHDALGFEFQPKILLHRSKEQKYIAGCMLPLFHERDSRNLFFYGKPGIGKTLAAKHVLDSIEDPEDDQYGDLSDKVYPIFVNCWQKNTSFKIVEDICTQLNYSFTQNKKTDELFKIISNMINRKSAVFVFDEIDKVQDMDFLYTILEQIYRKCIILITNEKDWILGLEDRVKSRLNPDILEFKPYTKQETLDILKQRVKYAFVKDTWDDKAFMMVADKTYETEDIRSGLHLMKEAGENAEMESSRTISIKHVEKALAKIDELSVKDKEELEDESKFILGIVKKSTGSRIGELYKLYKEEGGKSSYKTFQRKIQKLADGKFVNVNKITGGAEGSTTIVNYLRTKKLTEY